MKRQAFSTVIGEHKNRHVVRLVQDQSEAETALGLHLKHELLDRIAQQPDLTLCGTQRFSRLAVFHDGTAWVAEAEAIEYTDPET